MNENYDQVAEFYAQGKLSWEKDAIIALLRSGETFDPSAKTVADLSGVHQAVERIQGRWFSEGMAMGQPVAFQKVGAGIEFQVVVAQDVGNNNPNLLAFIDTNQSGSPITVQHPGTLIVRPVLPPEPPDDRPPTIGVWMRLPA
jgi:hypothetical protein